MLLLVRPEERYLLEDASGTQKAIMLPMQPARPTANSSRQAPTTVITVFSVLGETEELRDREDPEDHSEDPPAEETGGRCRVLSGIIIARSG
jgi:hypothetical protein